MNKIGLVLKLSCQSLDVLLLFLHVHIHLLGLCAQSSVLISSDIILDLEVSIHVTDFFFFDRFEDGRLVGFCDIGIDINTATWSLVVGAAQRHVVAATK